MKVEFDKSSHWLHVLASLKTKEDYTLYFQPSQIDFYPRNEKSTRKAVKAYNPYTGGDKITFIKDH